MMFIDMQCPLCGRVCGNSRGDFSVSCSCGWTGGIDPADQAAILGFLKRAKAWDDEASTEPACICKCMANRGGHCVAPNCRGPITSVDLPSPASDEEAAKRYDLHADMFADLFPDNEDGDTE